MTKDNNGLPIEEENETCGYCGSKINKKSGFYHEEITDWRNEQQGVGEEFYYHRECYRAKMGVMYASTNQL